MLMLSLEQEHKRDLNGYRQVMGLDAQAVNNWIATAPVTGEAAVDHLRLALKNLPSYKGMEVVSGKNTEDFLGFYAHYFNLWIGRVAILVPFYNDLHLPNGPISVHIQGFVARNVLEEGLETLSARLSDGPLKNSLRLNGVKVK